MTAVPTGSLSKSSNNRNSRFRRFAKLIDLLSTVHTIYVSRYESFNVLIVSKLFIRATIESCIASLRWSFDSCKKTDFEWKSLQNPFLGSSNRKLFGLWNTSDAIQLAYPKENIPFVRTNNGIQVDSTVYTLPENEDELVTYSVYMGGDIGESVITTNRPKLPNILIYGDSFTNPLETLLWTQANELRSIDFRYYTQSTLKDYITEHKPDIVICVRDETAFLSEAGNGITE